MLDETWPSAGIPTEEAIEDWIIDWYMDAFHEVGCDGQLPKPRGPPMWLAGKRWYDRLKKDKDEDSTDR